MRHPGWSPPSPGPVGVPSCSCLIGVAVSVLRCRRRRGTAPTERVRDPAPPLPECRAAHCRYGWYPNDGSNRTRRRRRIVVLPWLSEFWCNTRFFNALLAFFFGNRHWEEARYQLLVQYICIMIQSINRSERERELLVSLEVCLCWYLAVCFHRRRQLNDEQNCILRKTRDVHFHKVFVHPRGTLSKKSERFISPSSDRQNQPPFLFLYCTSTTLDL